MPNAGMNAAGPALDEYETPDWLFKALDHEFAFDLDGAARVKPVEVFVGKERTPLLLDKPNGKCVLASTAEAPVLWGFRRVFCNPPYSNIKPFLDSAWDAQVAVFILPTTTDNDWFDRLRWMEKRGHAELRYLRKRVKFCLNGQPGDSPRFTSLVAVVRCG